jgi:hypothetical protein
MDPRAAAALTTGALRALNTGALRALNTKDTKDTKDTSITDVAAHTGLSVPGAERVTIKTNTPAARP